MANSGWEPALTVCATCSAPGPHAAFNVPAGGAVCETCRPPGSARPARETIGLMAALLGGDWLAADASEPAARREASGLIAAHLQWHLERGLRSLPLVDRLGASQPVRGDAAGRHAGESPAGAPRTGAGGRGVLGTVTG
jgi:DNA repair protein RecO (recombination protein O)